MSHHVPAISVLMTVFNAGPYLAAAIESIQKQTFPDWEFLIVDDSSTDHSLIIAESYAEKDPRIKIIRNTINKGQTRCLNQGLAQASGAFIARQDADDLSHPERLKKQWQYFQEDPTLALLGSCGDMIDQKGRLIGILDVPLTHEVIKWSAAIKNPFLHTSVMFRAEVAQVLGGYDENYQIAQDYDLWIRMVRKYRAANLPERLISYRHLDSSLSKLGKSKAFQEALEIAKRGEKESFGHALLLQERVLIQAFREGEEVNQQKLFYLFKNLKNKDQYSFASTSQYDWRRLEAIYHLQGAGNKNRYYITQVNEVIAAFLAAPLYTMCWLKKRFFK